MDREKPIQAYARGIVQKQAGGIGREILPRAIGAIINGVAANRFSNWSADKMGLTDNEKTYSIPVVTGLGALGGLGYGQGLSKALQQGAMNGERAVGTVGKYFADKSLGMGATVLGADVLGTGASTGIMRGLDAMKASTEVAKQKLNETTQTVSEKFPGGLGGLVGAGVLSAAGALALWNISRAADRVASGRVIRSSISLRKRPGQITDVNFGVMPFKAKDERLNPMIGRAPDPVLDAGDED
jgi:hypothetical protein